MNAADIEYASWAPPPPPPVPLPAVSFLCRMDGKLARWEAQTDDIPGVARQLTAELRGHRGSHSVVLALIDNTRKAVPATNTTE